MAIRPTIKEENPEADFGELVSLIGLWLLLLCG